MLRQSSPKNPPTANKNFVLPTLTLLATTKLLLRLQAVTGAKSYHVQASPDGGKTWMDGVISTQARRIVIPGLTPGTVYAIRARGIGGSTGCSEWCQPMDHHGDLKPLRVFCWELRADTSDARLLTNKFGANRAAGDVNESLLFIACRPDIISCGTHKGISPQSSILVFPQPARR